MQPSSVITGLPALGGEELEVLVPHEREDSLFPGGGSDFRFRPEVTAWCRENLDGGWSISVQVYTGDMPGRCGEHLRFVVTLASEEDAALFRLSWL